MELVLDRKIADRRIFPAIDINKSGTRKEELLFTHGGAQSRLPAAQLPRRHAGSRGDRVPAQADVALEEQQGVLRADGARGEPRAHDAARSWALDGGRLRRAAHRARDQRSERHDRDSRPASSCVVRASGRRSPRSFVARRRWRRAAFVVGLPLDGEGEDTPRATECRRVAAELTRARSCRCALVDERYTTAPRCARSARWAAARRVAKGDVDALAATVLLQQALRMTSLDAVDVDRQAPRPMPTRRSAARSARRLIVAAAVIVAIVMLACRGSGTGQVRVIVRAAPRFAPRPIRWPRRAWFRTRPRSASTASCAAATGRSARARTCSSGHVVGRGARRICAAERGSCTRSRFPRAGR